MMDTTTLSLQEEKRFSKTYWFVCIFGGFLLILVSAFVFCHIPKENQQSANMALAFAMQTFTALGGYLVGASSEKKQQQQQSTQPPQINNNKADSIINTTADGV